jgi:hypothetical protein
MIGEYKTSGMIFLLLFPLHFTYNTIWLLVDGNWLNPPSWGIIGLTAVEIGLGLAIVVFANRRTSRDAAAG